MKRALTLAALALAFPWSANAAIVMRTYDFSATNFTSSFGGPIPYQSVSGSFTVTFDDTKTASNMTGVTVNNLSIPYLSSVLYSYTPSIDSLSIGANNDTGGRTGGTNDFYLGIGNASTANHNSVYSGFSYTAAGYSYSYRAGSVTITSSAPGAPAPALGLGLISALAGVGALGATRRRRKAQAA